MKLKKIIYTFVLLLVVILTSILIKQKSVLADNNKENIVNIYFFHSNECSHCNNEIKFLKELEQKYNNIRIYKYEISNKENSKLFREVQLTMNIKTIGVPLTIIGSTYYNGFNEEKSSIEFIKTIEYYKKYGYEDIVGKFLELENIKEYTPNKKNPTLEEFKENYGNYKLIGNLYTNDVDISLIPMILGILSQFNITKLISVLLIILILTKPKKSITKLSLLLIYITTSVTLSTTNIFTNELYNLIIKSLILILIIINILKYKKNKKTEFLYSNILILITFIQNYIENYFFNNYNQILKNLINLYNITDISKITYYINYIFTIIIINILIAILAYYIKKIITNNKKS